MHTRTHTHRTNCNRNWRRYWHFEWSRQISLGAHLIMPKLANLFLVFWPQFHGRKWMRTHKKSFFAANYQPVLCNFRWIFEIKVASKPYQPSRTLSLRLFLFSLSHCLFLILCYCSRKWTFLYIIRFNILAHVFPERFSLSSTMTWSLLLNLID